MYTHIHKIPLCLRYIDNTKRNVICFDFYPRKLYGYQHEHILISLCPLTLVLGILQRVRSAMHQRGYVRRLRIAVKVLEVEVELGIANPKCHCLEYVLRYHSDSAHRIGPVIIYIESVKPEQTINLKTHVSKSQIN